MVRSLLRLILIAACCAGLAATAAAESDLDHLVYLSWSATGEADTLAVADAGEQDLWLRVHAAQAPALFTETSGIWRLGAGLTITNLEIVTTGNPLGAVFPRSGGAWEVYIGDFDCTRGGDAYVVARLTIAVDPKAFVDGTAGVVPVAETTRVTFTDYDSELGCAGTWDYAAITPVVVLDAAVPNEAVSFGSFKAAYR